MTYIVFLKLFRFFYLKNVLIDCEGRADNEKNRFLYIFIIVFYITLTNFSMKYLVMCKVFTDVGGVK